jgi:hypothetical protein
LDKFSRVLIHCQHLKRQQNNQRALERTKVEACRWKLCKVTLSHINMLMKTLKCLEFLKRLSLREAEFTMKDVPPVSVTAIVCQLYQNVLLSFASSQIDVLSCEFHSYNIKSFWIIEFLQTTSFEAEKSQVSRANLLFSLFIRQNETLIFFF